MQKETANDKRPHASVLRAGQSHHCDRQGNGGQPTSTWTERHGRTDCRDVPFRECDLLPREKPSSWPPWGCLAFAIKLEHPTVRRGSLEPIALQGIFVGWNRRVPHGIKIATFRNDGEVEEVFTSTTVRTRDTVFSLFSGAGMKPATERV